VVEVVEVARETQLVGVPRVVVLADSLKEQLR
jgi:hypothetical protein